MLPNCSCICRDTDYVPEECFGKVWSPAMRSVASNFQAYIFSLFPDAEKQLYQSCGCVTRNSSTAAVMSSQQVADMPYKTDFPKKSKFVYINRASAFKIKQSQVNSECLP